MIVERVHLVVPFVVEAVLADDQSMSFDFLWVKLDGSVEYLFDGSIGNYLCLYELMPFVAFVGSDVIDYSVITFCVLL